MNSTDKKSLRAFQAMFVSLSQSVKRKYEEKAREAKGKNSRPLSRADTLRVASQYTTSARAQGALDPH